MPNHLQSYSSNFGSTFTNDLSIASVSASAGDYLFAAYSFRVSDPKISAAPTWNGQTFSLLHTSSDQSKTVYLYGLLAASGSTSSILASPSNWTYCNALIRVFTSNIAPTSTVITPVVSFEDGTTSPWSSPSNTVSSVASTDILVDFLFASDQDSGGTDLTAQTFTPGSGQLNAILVNNATSHYVGNISSSTKTGSSGAVTTSSSAVQQPVYIYITTGLRGAAAGPSISAIDQLVEGSTSTVTFSTAFAPTSLSISDGSRTINVTSFSGTGSTRTFTCPSYVDSTTGLSLGSVSITATDGTNTTPAYTSAVYTKTGYTSVTLAGTLNTTSTGGLYNFSPAAVVTDKIIYPTANVTYAATGDVTSDYTGSFTAWHLQASTGTVRSYLVTFAVPAGLSVTLTGVAATANKGTITASVGAAGLSSTLTGVASVASVGTITASLSGGAINTTLTGVAATAAKGTITASISTYVPQTNVKDTLQTPLVITPTKTIFRSIFKPIYRK